VQIARARVLPEQEAVGAEDFHEEILRVGRYLMLVARAGRVVFGWGFEDSMIDERGPTSVMGSRWSSPRLTFERLCFRHHEEWRA
jgi:hypothetical protein